MYYLLTGSNPCSLQSSASLLATHIHEHVAGVYLYCSLTSLYVNILCTLHPCSWLESG